MKKYRVYWTKRYFVTGDLVVEAENPDHAHDIVSERMGDLEGSLNYDDDEIVDVVEEVSDE
jgi:hypothetical protein